MAKEIEARLKLSAIDRTKKAFDSVSRNLDRIDHKTRQVERAQRGSAQTARLNRMSVATAGAEQQMIGLGRAVAVLATGIGAQKFISTAADFESALTGIQKKAGITAKETARLGKDILSLATSGDLAVSIDEIAAAYERGAAAGIPLEELREFASLSAKAADAFEMSATDVGNAAAGFSTVLKIPMTEMERYFDLINGLADTGIADEADIVNYVDDAGAMAKTFGLSPEQTAAFGATLANLKIEASKGATATNSIFARLLAPQSLSDAGRAAYDALIKDDKKFQKQLAEGKADEAFMSMVESLEKLDASARTGLLVDLFGREHMDTMLQIVEGSDELRRNLGYAAGTDWFGSLGKSYDLKLDDFWSRWQLLKNEVQRLTIDVGMSGMPALKGGLEGVRGLVQEIGLGLDAFRLEIDKTALDNAATALSELATQIGELLNMDTEGSALTTFFKEMATAVNDISAGVEATANGLDAIIKATSDPFGLKAAEGEAPADEQWRTLSGETVDGDPKGFGPVVREGSVADTVLDTLSDLWGKADERNRVARGLPSLPEAAAPTDMTGFPSLPGYDALVAAQADLLPGLAGEVTRSTGNPALPVPRPDRITPSESGREPSPPLLSEDISGIDELIARQEAITAVLSPKVEAGPPQRSGDAWHGWAQPGPIAIPDHSAEGSSGWRGGSFDEGRFGDDAVAIDGIDALRQAMDTGSQSLAQGGQQAGQSIAQGGAQLDAQGQAVGAAIRSAADYIAAQIRAALQTPVKVNMPSGGTLVGSMAGGATRPAAKSMPDAGVAGGQ